MGHPELLQFAPACPGFLSMLRLWGSVADNNSCGGRVSNPTTCPKTPQTSPPTHHAMRSLKSTKRTSSVKVSSKTHTHNQWQGTQWISLGRTRGWVGVTEIWICGSGKFRYLTHCFSNHHVYLVMFHPLTIFGGTMKPRLYNFCFHTVPSICYIPFPYPVSILSIRLSAL